MTKCQHRAICKQQVTHDPTPEAGDDGDRHDADDIELAAEPVQSAGDRARGDGGVLDGGTRGAPFGLRERDVPDKVRG